MRRAITLKSSLLRCLVGAGSGVGTNAGGGRAGAEEPLPCMSGMPLEGGTTVACPLNVGYGCEDGIYIPCTVECTGVGTPELLDTTGVLCAPLDDGADDMPDWAITLGGCTEGFTSGSTGEDGVIPGVGLGGPDVTYVGMYSSSTEYVGLLRLSGTGTFRASAIATASNEALGKRAAGSFARQRKMTISRAGGMFGLMSTGEGGRAVRCWDITAVGLSP